jgi:hypothetical protein
MTLCYRLYQLHNLRYVDWWDIYVNDKSARMWNEKVLVILRYWWN